jgi:tetratricopeptide (TPR) repeat protein
MAEASESTKRRVRRKRQVIIAQRLIQLLPAPLLLVAEGYLLRALLERELDVSGWLMLHGGVSLAAALWAAWIGRRIRRNQVAWFQAVTTAGLGPIGPATAIVTGLLLILFHRDWFDFQAWYASLFPADVKSRVTELYELLLRRRAASGGAVESFADILSGRDPLKKRLAISLLTRHFRPGFAPALKLALTDADASVRTQAATAIATIEGRFLVNAQSLTRKLAARPRSLRRRLAVARHYDDYAFTGLLDPERERDNRLKALEAYQRVLQIRPRDQRSWLAIGRILVRERRYGAAVDWFDTATGRDLLTGPMLLWQLEALFKLGRYERVRRLLGERRQLFAEGKQPPQMPGVLRLWTGQEQQEQREAAS